MLSGFALLHSFGPSFGLHSAPLHIQYSCLQKAFECYFQNIEYLVLAVKITIEARIEHIPGKLYCTVGYTDLGFVKKINMIPDARKTKYFLDKCSFHPF
jgi:hypothetical protein